MVGPPVGRLTGRSAAPSRPPPAPPPRQRLVRPLYGAVKKCERPRSPHDSGRSGATLGFTEVPLMNRRLAHVFSRLSIASVVAVSALGATACSRAASTDTGNTAAAAQPAKAAGAHHAPGYHFFREVEALDLRAAQRDALADVEQNLTADLAPHRETIRQVATTLAGSVEAGRIDPEEAVAQKAALTAAATEAKASFALALDEVHDNLDAAQRADLVARLRARHEHRAVDGAEAEAHRQEAMTRFATSLSLTEDQKQKLHEAFRDASEKVFPDRKVRREAWEAKMEALASAFTSDDFSAEDFDLAEGADEAIAHFGEVAQRAVEVSGKVLGPSQRIALAALIRDRATAPQR